MAASISMTATCCQALGLEHRAPEKPVTFPAVFRLLFLFGSLTGRLIWLSVIKGSFRLTSHTHTHARKYTQKEKKTRTCHPLSGLIQLRGLCVHVRVCFLSESVSDLHGQRKRCFDLGNEALMIQSSPTRT